jgi:P27 family predicted phage terminase small subunit
MKKKTAAKPYPSAPEHLSTRARDLWNSLGPNYASTTQKQVLLQSALEALDRAEEARRVITAEGMTKTTGSTGAVHLHPALRVEKDARNQFVMIWGKLGLAGSTALPFLLPSYR